jgi:hypothetical protein
LDWEPTDPRVIRIDVDDDGERHMAVCVPGVKRLADFDLSAAPSVNPATIATLAGGAYMDAGEPVVLLGDSGTGKSHLLIGLGVAACEQGRSVRYATCAQLVNELAEAVDDRRLSRLVARYGRVELLCLDEFGYAKLDTRGSELLFQILTEREEKSAIALASNLPFSKAHTFRSTCARCCLKRTGGSSRTGKSSSVNVVCQVTDEPCGGHAECLADDFGVKDRYQVDDACRAEPFRGRASWVEHVAEVGGRGRCGPCLGLGGHYQVRVVGAEGGTVGEAAPHD